MGRLMDAWHQDARATIYHGDCLTVLAELPDASVDAVVTDPPYELGFMGKGWDASGIAYRVNLWAEALRVLKPGGHLLAFGGTRTWHRLACAIEDAGFEVRDSIAWMYGSGFPKSLDVSKAIDKAAGAEREVVGPGPWNHVKGDNAKQHKSLIRPGGQHTVTAALRTGAPMTCDYCDTEFNPTATRWLCPACHAKHPCCDGAPLPITQEIESGHSADRRLPAVGRDDRGRHYRNRRRTRRPLPPPDRGTQ